MASSAQITRVLVPLVLGLAVLSPALAEDVEKKFRLGGAIGGWNAWDAVESDAANVLRLVDETLVTSDLFVDPRNDSAVFGELSVQAGPLATIYGQYAISKIFLVEASVGYSTHDLGDVEVQGQFFAVEIPDTQPFNFAYFRVPVGELERVPLQFTAIARFRPRASFNPYIGGGFGYTFIGFTPSAEFNELSVNMDASIGGQARLTSSFNNNPRISSPDSTQSLLGATVDAGDTFEWHVAGGAELSFRRNWAVFLDLRLTVASRSVFVGFDAGEDLGIAVPNLTDYDTSPYGAMTYGPVQVQRGNGGIIDGGSLQPDEDADPGTDCSVRPGDCVFVVGEFDGEVDPGFYYVQGGTIAYDGLAAQIGIRYTF